MKELLTYIIQNLVDHPDEVTVTEREAGNETVFEVRVADARSCCLHPATTTHRQLSDADLIACGVGPDLVRLSCGIEDAEDLIADIQQALDQI